MLTSIASSSALQTAAASQTAASSLAGMSGMDGSDFMLLLLAQLQNQNPLEPLNDRDMMTQFTQLVSLQELQKISAALENLDSALRDRNQLAEATSLIGKMVEYPTTQGSSLSGKVTGVSLVNGEIILWLGEKQIPLSSITSVKEVEDES